jgi:uncharacterized membrane protein (UPF0182 family)
MLVLPIQDTFLYIEPIYLQASEARMPQLKKVVLAMGNTLIYADSYEQALAQLAAGLGQTPEAPATVTTTTAAPAAAPATPAPPTAAGSAGDLKAQARRHLDRYRELMGQGKWSEAGKELEALQQLLSK